MAENATVKANQRRMIANTLKAGNKLTDAQKKQFIAAEIAAIRKSVKAGTVKSPGADTKIHKSRKATGGKTMVKGAGKNVTGKRRGTKITGSGGASVRKERAVKKGGQSVKSSTRYTGRKEKR